MSPAFFPLRNERNKIHVNANKKKFTLGTRQRPVLSPSLLGYRTLTETHVWDYLKHLGSHAHFPLKSTQPLQLQGIVHLHSLHKCLGILPALPRVPPLPLPPVARSLASQLRGQMASFSSCSGLLLLPYLNSDLCSKREERKRESMENSHVSVDLTRTRS